MKQDLEYQRRNNTFAIDQTINFHVNITDRFAKPDSPQYTYFWYNGSELIHRTDRPRYEQNFSQPTVLQLQAYTTAEFSVPDPSVLPPEITDKTGSFQEYLVFKGKLYLLGKNLANNQLQEQTKNEIKVQTTCFRVTFVEVDKVWDI